MIVLGLVVLISAASGIILTLMNRPLHEILIALGAVAAGGLARLLVPSPLNQRSFG